MADAKHILSMADAKISDIGKYRIIDLVGEGAMGVVYKAEDSVLGRTVAIKVMNDSIARQEDLRKRFLHEAQAAASLQHPNVVCIYDLGEQDGHLFIAMEFVDGVDLERLIELGEPMSLQARLDIIIDVLAHKRGIVHRDIKPANIRIGEDGRAKIMDFGVAHLASSSMTRTGSFLGTPSYMAPEQITEGKTTPATDIFAVGGVLYQLLAQMKPFDAPTLQNLFFKIITEKPRPISELMPGLPPALDRIVMKAMAKEPSGRYSSAIEMANDLSTVRAKLSGPSYPASVSLSASVATALEQARKSSQVRMRKNALIGAGALAAVALIAAAWSLSTRSRSGELGLTGGTAPITSAATEQPAATVTPPSTAITNATSKQQQPAPPPPTRQGRSPTTPRDTRVAGTAKPTNKPAQPVVVAPNIPSRVEPSAPSANARQETVVSAPPVTAPRPVVTAPAQEAPPPAPASPSTAGISPTVEAYARAIESRDISAIRRVYPGLTSDQQRNFEQFFQSARNINVTFRVANVEASGSSADARLVGTYEYVTSAGKTERQPVSFAATLRHDGNTWRLVSVR